MNEKLLNEDKQLKNETEILDNKQQITDSENNDNKKYKKVLIKKFCILCQNNENKNIVLHPFYVSFLSQFLNSKYMIKNVTSCSKHKKQIRRTIIISRHLGLLDY